MTAFAARRLMMVDTQIRPSDVTKYPIIDAMLAVPRERFVPDGQAEAAYVGENLTLADNRVLLEPRTLAKMLDALNIQDDELVLDIGCGYGYSAAVISHMAQAVVAVEEDESLSGEAQDASQVEAGSVVFADNCASCHADDGTGDRSQGAPNLADAIWLYGGDYASLTETVSNSRYGVMPEWTSRLSEAEIRAVSAYVHQLGGGE